MTAGAGVDDNVGVPEPPGCREGGTEAEGGADEAGVVGVGVLLGPPLFGVAVDSLRGRPAGPSFAVELVVGALPGADGPAAGAGPAPAPAPRPALEGAEAPAMVGYETVYRVCM